MNAYGHSLLVKFGQYVQQDIVSKHKGNFLTLACKLEIKGTFAKVHSEMHPCIYCLDLTSVVFLYFIFAFPSLRKWSSAFYV